VSPAGARPRVSTWLSLSQHRDIDCLDIEIFIVSLADGEWMDMKKDKRRAFLIYTDDWLSSRAITAMTAAEERGYFRLLLYSWNEDDCGLPDNDETLAQLSKLGRAWYGKSGPVVRAQFVTRDGRIFNERLLEERAYQNEVREKRSEAARAANAIRWASDSDPSRIANGSQTDPNRNRNRKPKLKHTVPEPEPDGTESPLLTPENITEAQQALAGHRRNGSTPDEQITRRILCLFDNMMLFRAWIRNIEGTVDPSKITGKGYALYVTNAQRWIVGGAQTEPKPIKYFDPTTITGEPKASPQQSESPYTRYHG
jgi:uncharacterized protein YdaU (DUF1376 family)